MCVSTINPLKKRQQQQTRFYPSVKAAIVCFKLIPTATTTDLTSITVG